jgi:hypothetical protein
VELRLGQCAYRLDFRRIAHQFSRQPRRAGKSRRCADRDESPELDFWRLQPGKSHVHDRRKNWNQFRRDLENTAHRHDPSWSTNNDTDLTGMLDMLSGDSAGLIGTVKGLAAKIFG